MNLLFVQLLPFVRDCQRLRIDDDALRELEALIMAQPEAGSVMPGTGGLRKIRFSPSSWKRGKSGATRVCYAYYRIASRVYLIKVFGKNEQENLSANEKVAMKKLLGLIEQELKGQQP